MDKMIRELSRRRKRNNALKRMIALLCVVVLLCTVNTLKRSANTLERIPMCGFAAEHVHSSDCYAGDALVCGLAEHVHTDACYQQSPEWVDSASGLSIEDPAVQLGESLIDEGDLELSLEDADFALVSDDIAPAQVASNAADNMPGVFTLGEAALVSQIIEALGLNIGLDEIVEVGFVDDGVTDDDLIGVEMAGNDYRVWAKRDFEVAQLALTVADGVVTVRLVDGVAATEEAEQAMDETQPDEAEPVGEAPATEEATPAKEDVPVGEEPIVAAPVPAEAVQIPEEGSSTEETIPEETGVGHEEAEARAEETGVGPEETAIQAEEIEAQPEKPEDQREETEAEPEETKEQPEGVEGQTEVTEAETWEQPDEAEAQTEEEAGEQPDEPEAQTEGEAGKRPDEGEAQTEAEAGEQPDEAEAHTEVTGDEAEGLPDEEAGTQPEEETEAPPEARPTYTATVDLSEGFEYPLSLNALIAGMIPEAANAGEAPAEGIAVEPAQAEDNAETPAWMIDYDHALLDIVEADRDYLITPVLGFESTLITADNGSRYALTLVNCALPKAEDAQETAYPAQAFEGHTAYVKVSVSAPEGAFPAGTAMAVADVVDDDTLENIEATVSEDFVEVKRVNAVDITFTDADGNEIEPLLPISVVLIVEEIDQDQDAVVVHMDSAGGTEVVAQDQAAAADQSEVAFSADRFSVYAVVVTQTIETKYIDAKGETWSVAVGYGAQAGIPAGATLAVEEVPSEDYVDQAADALPETRHITEARFFDITILDAEGQAVQPAEAVMVSVALADEAEGHVDALHFAENGVEVLPAERNEEEAVVFSAGGFSVYGIVYTVDFHYVVDGTTYDFSIPGGGYLSFRALVRALDIVQDDSETGLDEVQAFVDDVADVAFSAPGLVCVSKVARGITVGMLKQQLGLEAEASAGLTEQEIAEIDATWIEPVDWALISLKPFDTEEALTVAMKNGDRFEIRVTDAQISGTGELTDGKQYIIYTTARINGVNQNVALKRDGTYGIVDKDALDSLGDEYRWSYNTNGGSPTWTNGDAFIDVYTASLEHSVNSVNYTGGWRCGFAIIPRTDGNGGFDFRDLNQDYYLNWNIDKGGFIRNVGSGCRIRVWALPDDFSFTVRVDDPAHGSVSGYGVDGGQIISQDQFTTPGVRSGNVYVNAQRIVATSKTGWRFKAWELKNAWNGTVQTYTDRLLLPGSVTLTSDNMTLVAVYEKGEEPEWGEDDTVGQLLAEWKKGLTTESIKTDKTAQVYDYDNRIYQIDLKASSGRRAANPSVVINFITDTSRSMFFPANIYEVGSFSNSYYGGGLYNWLSWGEDKTGNVYYVIADQNDSATMYAVYFDNAANAWKFVDASYYQAEDGRTTTVYDVYNDISYSNGRWKLNSNGFILETTVYQAPKKEPGKLWTRLDYLCVAVEKATELLYEIDPNAEVHLTTFNKTAAYVGKFGKSASEIESMLRLISLSGGTRQDRGLQAAIDAGIFKYGNDKQQVAVLITDGAPNIKGETGIDWSTVWSYIEANADTLKRYRDASGNKLTLYTLGLFLERVGQNASRLDGIASAGKAGRADSSADIARTIENIIEGILQEVNLQGDVTDTIDPAFYPVKQDGTPLREGETFTDEFGHTGVFGKDADGNWTVTWHNQDFLWPKTDASGNITTPGWQGRIYVKAREDFLGGNTVSTNVSAKAEADRYLFGNQSYPLDYTVRVKFDSPCVNVDELSLTHNDTQWTVYLGTEVDPLPQVRKLFDEILVNEVVTQTVGGKHIVMTGSGDTLYPVTESDADGRSPKNGAVPETFRLADIVSLTDADWEDLVAGKPVTVPYGAYGHSGVGDIVVTLAQEAAEGEDDLTPSPHATAVKGQSIEKYTLTVRYVPAAESEPDAGWHTTPRGSRGKTTDEMQSVNTHAIHVFAKGLKLRKMDNLLEKTLTGAQFRLYRRATDTETEDVMQIEGVNCVPASGVFTVGADGIAEVGDIPAGVCYLVETRAPDGYSVAAPMPVTLTVVDGEKVYVPNADDINCPYDWAQTASLVLGGVARRSNEAWADYSSDVTPNSETATVYYRIPNNPGVRLPDTGGPGTAACYGAGVALIVLALALLLRRKSEY